MKNKLPQSPNPTDQINPQLPLKNNGESLISVDELIEILKARGLRIGRTGSDYYNTLRYYTKIGLIPHMIRKKTADSKGSVGHYPTETIALLYKIEAFRKQGINNDEIKRRLILEKNQKLLRDITAEKIQKEQEVLSLSSTIPSATKTPFWQGASSLA